MAITAAHIAAADVHDTTDQNTYTSPSWTPVANRLYLMRVRYTCTSGVVPTITDTTGLTWVLVTSSATGSGTWAGIYRAMKASGLSAGTTKVDATGATPTGCIIQIDEFQGTDTTGTNGSGAIGAVPAATSGSAASSSITINVGTTGSGVYSAVGVSFTGGVTPPTGFTELSDLNYSTPGSESETAFIDNQASGNQTVSATWSGANSWRAFAVEIKASGAAAPVNTVAPAVTGTDEPGQTLTSDNGTWTGTPTSYAYQWQANGVNIGGATANTYTIQLADAGVTLRCVVTATNGTGSAAANSNGVVVPSWIPKIIG